MKLTLFFTLLLATVLCFHGCKKVVYVVETPYTDAEGTDSDVNSSGDSNTGVIYDDDYFSEPGDGTKENPYSVSQAIGIINSGAYEPIMIRYVKGVVAFIVSRGRNSDEEWIIEYYISEDGSYEEESCLYMANGIGLGGNFFSSRDALSEGDKVIIYGYLGGIGGELEVLDSKLYYLNGEYADLGEYMEEGDGTEESPYAVWQALDMIYNGAYDSNKDYFVKGIVFFDGVGYSTTNGTLISYIITEAGRGLDGYAWGINIYYGWGLEGPFVSTDTLQAGDQVIVYGRFLYDDDIPQMAAGELYYLNGEYGTLYIHKHFMEPGDGTRENPYTVSQAVEAIGNDSYNPDKGYYVKGIIPYNGWSGGSGRDENGYTISYYISNGGGHIVEYETCLYINGGTALGGEKFVSIFDIVGLDQVIVYGKLTSDDGKAEMIDSQLVYWNGETAEAEE